MRAQAFVFGSVAAILLAARATHAAGPTQAELNAVTQTARTGGTWITTIVANVTRFSMKSRR